MPKIPSLSQTSKEYYMNGLTLDITVKTDVELLLEGQLIKVIFQKKKLIFNSFYQI